jgi:hypothetical protein
LTTGVPYLHAFDSTDPDTLEPGVPSDAYLEPWQLGLPFAPLPVFPLAIADSGIALKLWERTDAFQTDSPLVLNTAIMVDYSYGADGTPNGYDDEVLLLGVDQPPGSDTFRFQTYAPQISADGSVVAYEGIASPEQLDTSTYPATISSLGPALPPQIYAAIATNADWRRGPISFPLASSYADGTPMPFGAIDPALSADGKFIAFWSWDNGDKPQVYVKNLATGELKIASSDALGNPGVKNASGTFNAGFNTIAISADGRYVAFTSDAVLTPDDSGTGADLFVKDMQTGAIQRVPLPAGTLANDLSAQLTMTANGQYIAFTTSAGLAAMDGNHVADVYGISLAALGTLPQITINAVAGDDRINKVEDTKHVTVSGTSDAIGQTVTLYVDGGFLPGVVVAADGTWSTTIDATGLLDGQHALRATVSNANGATGSDGDLVTVDTIAPIVHLSASKSQLAAGQTATITASFSEAIGNITSDFLTANGGALSHIKFIDDHTLTAVFTASATTYSITAHPLDAFDLGGNPNVSGASITNAKGFDGYLSGSFVFADANTNGSFDAGEASTTTDASGNFTLSGSGPLILTGGTDISTGLPFTGTLEAPDGSAVVTPLTTVVEKLVESGDTVTQANDAVTAALGLPAGIDLTTLDAVVGTLSGDAAGTAAFKAGSELLDAITLIQAAGGSTDAAYAALAADVAAGSIINLADDATIKAIGQSAGLDVAAAQTVASIASETSAALETQLAHAATPFEIFVDITGASIAEQGDAASALSLAGDDAAYQQVAANYFQNLGTTLNQDDLIAADNVACYCRGTLIATPSGEVPAEYLKMGDLVLTGSGALRPIKWIGRRSYGGRFLIGQKHILPVCIRAGALGENTPRRDLWISPHHAMYLEGVLIEARDLVNGINVVQPGDTADVEYFHIELDAHDVIVAEGALSETFIDDDSRGMFHNVQEYYARYPDEAAGSVVYYAPRCDAGYAVEAARRNIEARAGLRAQANDDGAGRLRGYVDVISPTRIAGWAQNEAHPEAPVCLDIIVDGECIDQILANTYREDLCRAGLGSGHHSFSYLARPDRPIPPGFVEIRRSLDGTPLPASVQCRNVRASTASRIGRAAIMKRAWAIFREAGNSRASESRQHFAACLRQAWAESRTTRAVVGGHAKQEAMAA